MIYPRQYNAVCGFVDCHLDSEVADKVAFVDPEHSITYGELGVNTHRMANLLSA